MDWGTDCSTLTSRRQMDTILMMILPKESNMYNCANCNILSCGVPNHEHMPINCPMRNENLMANSFKQYSRVEDFFIASSEIEAIGYGKWPRLREVVEFCKRMGYVKIGMAFCRGLRNEAKVIDRIFKANDLEVVSVVCKTGGISKEKAGIKEEQKLRPEEFEPMCNPIAQAELLNEQRTQFNVAVGLCVGHDSLFFKHSDAMVTTLIAKDRVLAHNPVGAVYCADGYYQNKLMSQPKEQ